MQREPRSRRCGAVPGALQRVAAPEQGRDACEQMLEPDALDQIIVGAEAQTRYGIDLAVARGQKYDRQAR